MSPQTTFPCIACGGPNEPEVNRDYMPCTYCGTNLEIPKHLRRKIVPHEQKSRITATKEDMDVPDLIRKAQPVAARALNLYFLWTWVRRMIPTCFVIVMVFIGMCVLAAGAFVLLRGN